MRVTETIGIICELSEDELAKLRAIAERDGITPSEALTKSIQNFLNSGVQTPKSGRASHAA